MGKKVPSEEISFEVLKPEAVDDETYDSILQLMRGISRTPDAIKLKREYLERILSYACRTVVLILRHKGTVVGMAQATHVPECSGERVWIGEISLSESMQGKGLGDLLMNELGRLISRKWPEATEVAMTSNPERQKEGYYRRFGIRKTGTDFYRGNLSDWHLARA